MKNVSKLLILMMVLFGTVATTACNEAQTDQNNDIKTEPAYSEILEMIQLVGQVEDNVESGLLLSRARDEERDTFLRYMYDLRVILYRLKANQNDPAAQNALAEITGKISALPIIRTDSAQITALLQKLEDLKGMLQIGTSLTEGELFVQKFGASFGDFSQYRVTGNVPFKLDAQFNNVNVNAFGSNAAAETWLISPAFNFDTVTDPRFSTRQAVNYLKDWKDLSVLVSNDYVTGNPNDATWTELEIEDKPAVDSRWKYVSSEEVSLEGLVSSSTVIAFRYKASADGPAAWQIDNVTILGTSEGAFTYTGLQLNDGKGDAPAPGGNNGGGSGGNNQPSDEDLKAVAAQLKAEDGLIFHDWFNRAKDDMLKGYSATSLEGDNEWLGGSRKDNNSGVLATYLSMSGFKDDSDNHDWLVTPEIDLTGTNKPYLQLVETIGFISNWDDVRVAVSTDYAADKSVEQNTWSENLVPRGDLPSSWTDYTSAGISLEAFKGKKIRIGFQYRSKLSAESVGTWRLQEILVADGEAPEPEPPAELSVLPQIEVADDAAIFHDWFNREPANMLEGYSTTSITGDQTWRSSSRKQGETVVTGLQVSGFADRETSDNADWLVSPEIDLTDAEKPFLQLFETINFIGDWNDINVVVTSEFDATKPVAENAWSENIVPRGDTFPSGWTDYKSSGISLDAYRGKKIRIGFFYQSKQGSEKIANWAIQEILVADGEAPVIEPEEPGELSVLAKLDYGSDTVYFHDWFNRIRPEMIDGYDVRSYSGAKEWAGGSSESDGSVSATYLQMSGFRDDADSNDWIVTPEIDLSEAVNPYFTLIETIDFLKDWADLQVFVTTSFDAESDFGALDWGDSLVVRPDLVPENGKASLTSEVDLTAYAGKKVRIGFRYLSKVDASARWRIEEILVANKTVED